MDDFYMYAPLFSSTPVRKIRPRQVGSGASAITSSPASSASTTPLRTPSTQILPRQEVIPRKYVPRVDDAWRSPSSGSTPPRYGVAVGVVASKADVSPVLPAQTDFTLPPIESNPLEISFGQARIASASTSAAPGRSRIADMATPPPGSIDFSRAREAEPAVYKAPVRVQEPEANEMKTSSYHIKRPSTSDSASLHSSTSSRGSSRTAPSIPSRLSSRKAPALPSRGSSLKLAALALQSAPPPPPPLPTPLFAESAPTPRRLSTLSVVSADSILDPYPALTSVAPSAYRAQIRPGRRYKQARAASFSSTLPPVPASPIQPWHLSEYPPLPALYRTRSAPAPAPSLSLGCSSSDMPSFWSPRQKERDRAPIDFSASPTATPQRGVPRRLQLPLLDFDLFSSPVKPSPFAIEHRAEPGRPSSTESTFIPLYHDTLSPHAGVTIRPISHRARRQMSPSEDVYAECKRADKMQAMIDQMEINEAFEAIKEAEAWIWAKPPARTGRTVHFAFDDREDEEPAAPTSRSTRHGHASRGSCSSSTSTSASSFVIPSESHSTETMMSEESQLLTPSTSSSLLRSEPLSTIHELRTPVPLPAPGFVKPTLPQAPASVKSVYSGGSILKTSSSTSSQLSNISDDSRFREYMHYSLPSMIGPEPMSMAMPQLHRQHQRQRAKSSRTDLESGTDKVIAKSALGAKDSEGRRGGGSEKVKTKQVKKKPSAWSYFPDVGAMSSMM